MTFAQTAALPHLSHSERLHYLSYDQGALIAEIDDMDDARCALSDLEDKYELAQAANRELIDQRDNAREELAEITDSINELHTFITQE